MSIETIEGKQYIVNILTRAVALVTQDTLDRIQDIGFVPQTPEDEEIIRNLMEDWFIVEDDFDESSLLRYYTNKLKYTTNEAGIDATVLTTYRCNMECSYCYESGVKEDKDTVLNEKISDSMITWLNAYSTMKKVNDIFVDFYGGEPLLNKKMMIYFMKKAAQESQHYRFSSVTNGTLLTKETVKELKPLGFTASQVTLDGPELLHDDRRRMKSGKGTFDVIFNNILNVVDDIGIGLSINTDRQNYEAIPEFLDFLASYGLADKIVLAFNIVQPAVKEQEHCKKHIFNAGEVSESQFMVYKAAVDKGFNIQHRIVSGVCRSQHEFSVVFDPVGDIYPCPATVGIDKFYSGNVTQPLNEFYRRWSQHIGSEPWNTEECLDCKYLPICLGGCRHQLYTSLEKFDGPICHKDSFKGDTRIMILRALHNQEKGDAE